jgi:hypothetical protein
MSLKDRLKQKSDALVKREKITLPRTGEVIGVKGLMSGDLLRCSEHKGDRQSRLFVALGTEDPETGSMLWNPNDMNDLDAIGALHNDDMAAILNAVRRISGLEEEKEEGKAEDSPTSSSSSASDTESSRTISAVA